MRMLCNKGAPSTSLLHMHLFDQVIASIIGVLIAALPAPAIPVSRSTPTVTAGAVASTSIESSREHLSALIALRESLARFRDGLIQANNTEQVSVQESNDTHEQENESDISEHGSEHLSVSLRGRNNGATQSREEVRGDDGSSWGHSEDSDENEWEDDEDSSSERTRTAPVATKPTPPASTPQPTSGTSPKTFTLAQVAAHASITSCYSVVQSTVYDLTSWISKHPGGAGAIKSMCGVDATAAFAGQHGGQARPVSELAGFKIGTLVQ